MRKRNIAFLDESGRAPKFSNGELGYTVILDSEIIKKDGAEHSAYSGAL